MFLIGRVFILVLCVTSDEVSINGTDENASASSPHAELGRIDIVEILAEGEVIRSAGQSEASDHAAIAKSKARRSSVSSRPTLSKAVLGVLCFLGDAAVDVEAISTRDCHDVVVPPDYEEFCGRWQCSDPRVDLCFFTDADSVLLPQNGSQEENRTSLAASSSIQWPPSGISTVATTSTEIRATVAKEPKFLRILRHRRKQPKINSSLITDSLVSYANASTVVALNSTHLATAQALTPDHVSYKRLSLEFPLRWRPASLRPCNVPSFTDFFNSSRMPQCDPELPDSDQSQEPICSLEEWERSTWKDFFSEQRRLQEIARVEKNASSSPAVVNETIRLWRRQNQCGLLESFWQCDSYNGHFLSSVWRRFGESLVDKLNGSADFDATPTVVTGSGAPPTNNTTSAGTKLQQWRHCANEGELCLCTGDVRFGVVGQWAPDILTVRHGIVSCSADLFAGASSPPDGETHVCECTSGHSDTEGPLIVPSLATTPTSEKLMRTNESKPDNDITHPRFLRGIPYTNEIRRGVTYDYASVGAGARIVTYAKGIKRARSVLAADHEYLQTTCTERSWFVLSLLEDLLLEHVGLVTLEFFASGFRHLQILGSSKYPTDQWRLLGEIETSPTATHELFNVGSRCRDQVDGCWIKFLKVRVLSHHELEQNTYCALTRFQAFGSTQITHLAEEKKAQDDAGRQPDPTVADIVEWHDKAAHGALSSLFGEDVDSVAQEYVSPSDDHSGQNKSSISEDVDSSRDAVDSAGLAPANSNAFQRGIANGFESVKKFIRTVSSPFTTNLQLPDSDSGTDSGESEVEADGAILTPDEKATEPASTAERARSSLSEVLQELNVSGTLSDADLSTFERLRTTLASLNGSAADLVATTSASISAGALATASTPPKPRTSSSTPVLVRIADEVQIVQDKYTALDKKMKGVASGLSSVLVFIVEALREHDAQVRHITDAQEPLREMLSQYSNDPPSSNSSESSGQSIPSLRTVVPVVWKGMFDNCSYQMFTFDRCLIFILFIWNLCLRCSGESREKPRTTSGEWRHAESPDSSPSLVGQELKNPTSSGASGHRLLREHSDRSRGRVPERPSQIVTDEMESLYNPATLSTSGHYPQRPAGPPLEDYHSSSDASDPDSPTAFKSLRSSMSQLFGFEGSSSTSRGRRPPKAFAAEAGGSRHQRGPKRHSSAARRHPTKRRDLPT